MSSDFAEEVIKEARTIIGGCRLLKKEADVITLHDKLVDEFINMGRMYRKQVEVLSRILGTDHPAVTEFNDKMEWYINEK